MALWSITKNLIVMPWYLSALIRPRTTRTFKLPYRMD